MSQYRPTLGLQAIVDLDRFPLDNKAFQEESRQTLDRDGVVQLSRFLTGTALAALNKEALSLHPLAYFTQQHHTVYLDQPQQQLPPSDARSWKITSTKGAVTTDQIPSDSPLKTLYNSGQFQSYLCSVLGEKALYPYADPLSSININYYQAGQELGWHFDHSSFSITLLTQTPTAGGHFQYLTSMRNSAKGDQNYSGVSEILAGGGDSPGMLPQQPGDLVVFRGRDTLHRVTPIVGQRMRILNVLAYNVEPNQSLSEHARMTFFGRLG